MTDARFRRVLHVGCGLETLPDWIAGEEVRLDINPENKPDIVASMTNLGDIGEFDGVYSCHALEHLSWVDVGIALREFHRVLKPGGFLCVIVPNLEGIKPTLETVYEFSGGAITGLHMIYGHLDSSDPHMQHKCGFVKETMLQMVTDAGFQKPTAMAMPYFSLMGAGIK